MTNSRTLFLLCLLMLAGAAQLLAQQSDYEITQNFERRYDDIKNHIDSSATTTRLDSLKAQIDALEVQFAGNTELLDKAFYPETFASRIQALRKMQAITYNRAALIESQGGRIGELETQLTILSTRLDTLTGERNRLFSELEESRKSVAALRDAVKRLTLNLQAHERLVFSMIDSIFQPYGHDISQSTDVQKAAVEGKLERANIVTRVYDIAADNVRFLEATQLQGKDYANLIEQYQQFKNRWTGLSGNINAVVAAAEKRSAAPARGKAAGKTGFSSAAAIQQKGASVDSLLADWNQRLQAAFWAGLEKEFTAKGVPVAHFTDGPSFSASIRGYVASMKESGTDASIFVDEVWKGRIDKEWRDALSKDAMIGKTEYAALDHLVSELDQKTIDMKLILYVVAVLIIVGIGWWLLSRKPKKRIDDSSVAP